MTKPHLIAEPQLIEIEPPKTEAEKLREAWARLNVKLDRVLQSRRKLD